MKQATTPTITVRNTPTGWVADFSSHPEGAESFRLFGTHELPLPLTARASFALVVETLAKGHPEARVVQASRVTTEGVGGRGNTPAGRQGDAPRSAIADSFCSDAADPRQDWLDSFDA